MYNTLQQHDSLFFTAAIQSVGFYQMIRFFFLCVRKCPGLILPCHVPWLAERSYSFSYPLYTTFCNSLSLSLSLCVCVCVCVCEGHWAIIIMMAAGLIRYMRTMEWAETLIKQTQSWNNWSQYLFSLASD